MDVTLEAIKFNHIEGSATSDGFSIRHNETRPVLSPEWQRGVTSNSEDSPAAYALAAIKNQTLTIKARTTCSDPGTTSLWIRAVDGNVYPEKFGLNGVWRFLLTLVRPFLRRLVNTNVLGAVRPTRISPSTDPDDFEIFELEDVRLQDAGIGVNEIIWRWQFTTNGRGWTDIITTRHRIYSVFQMPVGTWKPLEGASNTQLPWTEVLEYACRWAAGARRNQIAGRITEAVNSLGPAFIQYDTTTSGSPHYAIDEILRPPRVDCQRFLDLLHGDSHNPKDPNVDCDDCAAIVSTFACILGYCLPASSMFNPAGDIPLRRHEKIGRTLEGENTFNHHTVAWQGGLGDAVSDACLKLDANEGVGGPALFLAEELSFTSYRHLLVPKGQESKCQPTPHSTVFRRVGLSLDGAESVGAHFDLERIKRLYSYDEWPPVRATDQPIDIINLLQNRSGVFGWAIQSLRFVPATWIELFLSQGTKEKEGVLRVDVQVGETAKQSNENLLSLLGRFELPGVKLKKDPGFGDRVFANDAGFVILFSRSNLVVQIRNITGAPIALWNIAQAIDKFLLYGG